MPVKRRIMGVCWHSENKFIFLNELGKTNSLQHHRHMCYHPWLWLPDAVCRLLVRNPAEKDKIPPPQSSPDTTRCASTPPHNLTNGSQVHFLQQKKLKLKFEIILRLPYVFNINRDREISDSMVPFKEFFPFSSVQSL